MRSLIAATARREPMHRKPIHRKAAARFPAAFRALFRFPTRTVRKPQEAVASATIEASLTTNELAAAPTDALGFDEQISGVNQQIPGRGQSD